jgi:PhnB protein
MKMTTYVNFRGNCEEAFQFYEKHLGGKVVMTMKWSQMPDAAKHTPPGMEDKVLHSAMSLGETVLLGADIPGAEPMRSAYLTLSVDSSDEAERIYTVLVEGGQEFMKMKGETFFAYRFGQLRDRFGINWMIIHERPVPEG